MINEDDKLKDLLVYEFITKDKQLIKIYIEDTDENPRFRIEGPKELINKVIGGIGFDTQDGKKTLVTEVSLNTEAKRMFAVLEITKRIQLGEL